MLTFSVATMYAVAFWKGRDVAVDSDLLMATAVLDLFIIMLLGFFFS